MAVCVCVQCAAFTPGPGRHGDHRLAYSMSVGLCAAPETDEGARPRGSPAVVLKVQHIAILLQGRGEWRTTKDNS